MTPFEILKKTPKSNCRQCGYQTCLAFAAAVSKSGENPQRCPFIETTDLQIAAAKPMPLDKIPQQRELELIEHLKGKISDLNLAGLAGPLGAKSVESAGEPSLSFRYLGQEVLLSKTGVLLDASAPGDHRDQILLYNYVHSRGSDPPTLDWIGLESLPNSLSKVKTLSTYCEERLAKLISSASPEQLAEILTNLDGKKTSGVSATLSAVIPVLPFVPQLLLFWAAEPEDGFPAKAKILFDRGVLHFLDIESLVFSAERLADRIAALLASSSLPATE